MKKIMVVFAMVMMNLAIANVKAENANVVDGNATSVEAVVNADENGDAMISNFHICLREMNKAMHLDADQVNELRCANGELSRNIARLKFIPAAKRQAKLANILAENLATVHEVVDEEQYRAYLCVLNNEFNKSGLSNILYGYNQLAAK